MPHPTPTLQLRSITTCVLLTRNINMPHPTPPHFKNNNPRGGGESAAHQKEQQQQQQPHLSKTIHHSPSANLLGM